MHDSSNHPNRRNFLSGVIVLPALAVLLLAQRTTAEAGESQSQAGYQNKPMNGKKCSQCTFFIKGSSATSNGTCKVVNGAISPNGWCKLFTAK
jgi:High potential iron-sulfur protein